MDFTLIEIIFISLIFVWIGFVRTGLGFGGAVLGLPLLMLVGGSPIDWLPIIGIHLLFFSGIALVNSLKTIDWSYLKQSLPWICLLYTSPSPRDRTRSRMPSSA